MFINQWHGKLALDAVFFLLLFLSICFLSFCLHQSVSSHLVLGDELAFDAIAEQLVQPTVVHTGQCGRARLMVTMPIMMMRRRMRRKIRRRTRKRICPELENVENGETFLCIITWPSEFVSDPGLVKPGVFVTEFYNMFAWSIYLLKKSCKN